jgi:hypothetical protein
MATSASEIAGPKQLDEGTRPLGSNAGTRVPQWTALWTGVLSLLPLGLLGAASLLGRRVRPGADEWCFLPVVRDDGISGLIGKFYLTDNGRLGNAVLVWMYAKPGVAGHQWFGLISGVFMLGILWALIAAVLGRAGRTAPRGVPLLVASMVTAVFLFATPNTYKTFYWPASSVSHTLAPVLACAAAIPPLLARSRRGKVIAVITAIPAGSFLSTLSEETSVVSLVVLLTVLLLNRRTFARSEGAFARAWCFSAIAGIVIGILVLLTSPGSRARRERYGAGTTSMFAPESLTGSLRAFGQILGTVLTTWPYLGVVAAGVLLGLLAGGGGERAAVPPPRRPLVVLFAGALAFLASGYLCTVITYPAFGARVMSASRTWNDYLLLYIALLVAAGALTGRAARLSVRLPGRRRNGALTAAAAAVCATACLGLAAPLYDLGHNMGVRARNWDRQDQWLRAQARAGAQVLPYTPVSVSGMVEPFGGDGQRIWPARCIADYYHLKRITYSKQLP